MKKKSALKWSCNAMLVALALLIVSGWMLAIGWCNEYYGLLSAILAFLLPSLAVAVTILYYMYEREENE